jgi:hypothetical protein
VKWTAGETTTGRLEERMYEDFLRGETVLEASSLPWTVEEDDRFAGCAGRILLILQIL